MNKKGDIREYKGKLKPGDHIGPHNIEIVELFQEFDGKRWRVKCKAICPRCGDEFVSVIEKVKSGHTHSCGCLCKKVQPGEIYNGCEAIKFLYSKNEKAVWLWKCHCGNFFESKADNIKSGHTHSCGCLHKKVQPGEIYNGCEAIKFLYVKNGGTVWLWKCHCGNYFTARSNDVKTGKTTSCGCLYNKSVGEQNIKNILNENNIHYKWNHRFPDCRDKLPLPFDFYIEDKYIIEFDGIQHHTSTDWGWNTGENLLITQSHDKIKNEYCFSHDIPIIRIPYSKRDTMTIEDLKPETSKYLVRKEEKDG